MTLRELCWMADGRRAAEWDHTAAILAWIGNNNPYMKRRRAYVPADFHPYVKRSRSRQERIRVPITVLKDLLEGARNG